MQDLQKIVLCYHRVKGLTPRVAHGVYGGIAPGNTVELEFFSESEDYSGTEEVVCDENGNISTDEYIMPGEQRQRRVVRTIHTRILMNKVAARNMLNWLGDILDNIEAADKAQKDEDEFEGIDKNLIYSKTRQ